MMSGQWHPEGPQPVHSSDMEGLEHLITNGHHTLLFYGSVLQEDAMRTYAFRRCGRRDWSVPTNVYADVDLGNVETAWTSSSQLTTLLEEGVDLAWIFSASNYNACVEGIVCARRQRPIIPIIAVDHRILVGPELQVGTHEPVALFTRLLSNVPGYRSRVQRNHFRLSPSYDWNSAYLSARLLWEVPSPSRRSHQALVIDLLTGEVSCQSLAYLSDSSCNDVEELIGGLIGVVREVGPVDTLDLNGIVSIDTAVGGLYTPRSIASASSILRRPSQTRALCEAAERLAAESIVSNAFLDNAKSLGIKASEWLPFSNDQYSEHSNLFTPLESDDVIHWTLGQEIWNENSILIPTRLVGLDPRCSGPCFAPLSSTGLAAGRDNWSAIVRGLLEVVERDVITRCWIERSLDEMDPFEWAPMLFAKLKQRELGLRIWICNDDAEAPVIAAWIGSINGDGALGSAAGMDICDAVEHAIEEAALMFVHRSRRSKLLSSHCCPDTSQESRQVSILRRTASINSLIERYNPWWVDITDRNSDSVGLRVVSVGSLKAVDFLGPGRPLAKRKWQPESDEEYCHEVFPFASPTGDSV